MIYLRFLGFLLFRPPGLMFLGALIAGFGVVMIFVGAERLPARAELTQVSGMLDNATKIRRQRKGSVSISYELEIKSGAGKVIKLTLSEHEISEQQVTGLLGRPVVALVDGRKDVWELASGATTVIAYETTRRLNAQAHTLAAEVGPYMTGGGVLVSLLGFFVLLRRQRAAEAAA